MSSKGTPARQPLEMPGRYRFHATRPAPWKRFSVARRPRVRGRCFSFRLWRSGTAWEDRSGRTIVIHFVPGHSTQVRDSRPALCRQVAFDLRCCGCRATSSITSPVSLNARHIPGILYSGPEVARERQHCSLYALTFEIAAVNSCAACISSDAGHAPRFTTVRATTDQSRSRATLTKASSAGE